jgi:hypothetical protein
MKKVFKTIAFIIGLGSLLLGTNSCKKDDPKKCCTWTFGGFTYKYCVGDTYYPNGPSYDGVVLKGDAWSYYRAHFKDDFLATCN